MAISNKFRRCWWPCSVAKHPSVFQVPAPDSSIFTRPAVQKMPAAFLSWLGSAILARSWTIFFLCVWSFVELLSLSVLLWLRSFEYSYIKLYIDNYNIVVTSLLGRFWLNVLTPLLEWKRRNRFTVIKRYSA